MCDILTFPVHAERLLVHPGTSRAVGVANIKSRRKGPTFIFIQKKSKIPGMVIAVSCDHIEHHPAKELFRIGIGEPKQAKGFKELLITV